MDPRRGPRERMADARCNPSAADTQRIYGSRSFKVLGHASVEVLAPVFAEVEVPCGHN